MKFWKRKKKKRELPFHPLPKPRYRMPLNPEQLGQIFRDCGDFCAVPVRLGGAEGEVRKLSGKRIGHGRDSGKERDSPLTPKVQPENGNLSG